MSPKPDLIGETFLRGMATLCGAATQSPGTGALHRIAEQHHVTLVAECGVDTSAVLRRELAVFDDLPEQDDPAGRAPLRCLGTTCEPLAPGALDDLLPPTPSLLHYPTRGKAVADPEQGDTLIPLCEVGMMVGQGSAGKSMFFLQLALSIAADIPFLGKFPVGRAAAKRPVVLVCAEDRRDQITRRLQLISRQLINHLSWQDRRAVEGRIYIVSVAGTGTERILLRTVDGTPSRSQSFDELAAAVREIGPALVVLDPLSRLLSGNVDLSSEVGTEWVSMLESLIKEAPIAVWFAHHSNKASRRPKVGAEHEEPEARGTSGLFDAVRVEAYLAAHAKSQVAFRVRKNNHGPRMEFADREILIRGEHGILRATTPEEAASRADANAKEKAQQRDQADHDTQKRILVALALNPATTSKETLRNIVGRGKAPFERAFAYLLACVSGNPPMVNQVGRGTPFLLNGNAIALRYPERVNVERGVVEIGTWSTNEWPEAIRGQDASVALNKPGSAPASTDRTHERSPEGIVVPGNEAGGEAAGAATTTTGLRPPKGEPQSGRMGRPRTPPYPSQLPPTRDSGSDSESAPSPVAVQSGRRCDPKEAP